VFVKLVTLEFSPFVLKGRVATLTLTVVAQLLGNTEMLIDFGTLLSIVLSHGG